MSTPSAKDFTFMRRALRLAARAYGQTSPNPMVGAVIVKRGKIIGEGWHHHAGEPHAEIEALRHCARRRHDPRGTTLYVSLEPCCTDGRTPPCTDAIISSGIKRVVGGATDPNPVHAGRSFRLLRRAGLEVLHGALAEEASRLNESFNHWIVHDTPFVTVKAAMTLDGKIATRTGESKWITGEPSRGYAMKLRQGSDAILVGINTVVADNPSLTLRSTAGCEVDANSLRQPLRIVLDSEARTPISSKLLRDLWARRTIIIASPRASERRVERLRKRVRVEVAPLRDGTIDVRWLMKMLGKENITSLLVEGGGEVNASFLFAGLAHRVAFFYAPKIIGGRTAPKAVAGDGITAVKDALTLRDVEYRWLGEDLLLTARVEN